MLTAESSADLQDLPESSADLPACPGGSLVYTGINRDTAESECLDVGGNVPSPTCQQIQTARFKIIIHFTALLKSAKVHVDP